MSYLKWFESHAKKHKEIIEKLEYLSTDEIIDYFSFENMVKNEPDFCPLYKQNKKCHKIEELNCYFCACTNFRFIDETKAKEIDGKKQLSYCSINSKDGSLFHSKMAIHQNCTNCLVPHKKNFIKKNFSKNWIKAMKEVIVK